MAQLQVACKSLPRQFWIWYKKKNFKLQKYPQNKEGAKGSVRLLKSRLAQKACVKTKINLPMQHTLCFKKSSAQVSSLPCALGGVFVMCCKANKLG